MSNYLNYIKIITIIMILSIALTSSLLIYSNSINKKIDTQSIDSLEDASSKNIEIMHKEVKYTEKIITGAALEISKKDNIDIYNVVETLEPLKRIYDFNEIGVITPDGKFYKSDGTVNSLENFGYSFEYAQSEMEKYNIGIYMSKNGRNTAYTAPLYDNNQNCIGYIYATYNSDYWDKTIKLNSDEKSYFSYIISPDGEIMIAPPKGNFTNKNNIFDLTLEINNDAKSFLDKIKSDIKNNKSGSYISSNDNYYFKYIYYEPLGINDWYIISFIPLEFISSKTNSISYDINILLFSIILLFYICIFIIVILILKHNKKVISVLYRDDITGGDSYIKFEEDAKTLIPKYKNKAVFAIIDLDKFKLVNEMFGIEEGNKIIKILWKILIKYKNSDDIIAHRYADEFVAIFTYNDISEIKQKLENIEKQIQIVSEKHNKSYIKLSIGIYEIKEPNIPFEIMYSYANMAKMTIKGRNDLFYAFYNDSIRKQMLEIKELEDNLEEALKNNEFEPWYQPKYSTDGDLMGSEALIRWRKKDGTIIPPDKFIHLCETNGFIRQIDWKIFIKTCKQMKDLIDKGNNIVPVSINLSKAYLYDINIVKEFKNEIDKIGLPHKYIQFEITESDTSQNIEKIKEIISEFHKYDFKLLLDDFGTGYSSLTSIQVFDFDILKLDKMFIKNIGTNRGDNIVLYTINIAKSLGMETIAEGVETKEQFEFLKNNNCDYIQGYYFSKPLNFEEYKKILK